MFGINRTTMKLSELRNLFMYIFKIVKAVFVRVLSKYCFTRSLEIRKIKYRPCALLFPSVVAQEMAKHVGVILFGHYADLCASVVRGRTLFKDANSSE